MLGGVQPQSRFQHLAPCAKVILLSGRKDAKPQGRSCRGRVFETKRAGMGVIHSCPDTCPILTATALVDVPSKCLMPGDQDIPLPVSTSMEPEFDLVQESLYREVLTLLNERQIPYAVSGAFALQQHTGIWRVTKDLDLFLTTTAVHSALSVLRSEGFRCEICDPVWLAKAHREDFFVDLITGMYTILLIILILLLIGALPTWPYSTGWGYYPSGGLGLIVLILIILLLMGRL